MLPLLVGKLFLAEESPWDDPLAPFLAIAGILVLIVVVLRMGTQRRRRRSSRSSREPSPTRYEERPLHAGGEMSDVLVQIQSVTREIEARLDTRVRLANRLLQESEQVLGRLEQLIREARGIVGDGVVDTGSAVSREPPDSADPQRGQRLNVVSEPTAAAPPASTPPPPAASPQPAATPAAPGPPAPTPPEPAPPAAAVDPETPAPTPGPAVPAVESAAQESEAVSDGQLDEEHEEIHRLAAQGLPVAKIAKQVGRPAGEVELILALAKTAGRSKST